MTFNDLAIQAYPNETGAVFIGGTMYPVRNIAKDPTKSCEFDGAELTQLELKHGKIDRIVHSHPYNPAHIQRDSRYQPQWASTQDMRTWISLNIPFGIVATDGHGCSETLWYDDSKRAPLLGREFVHGLWDCYSLIRDYYHLELKIDLLNFARGWDWWNLGENLYLDNFEKAGFVEVPRNETQTGDVIIYTIGTQVPNHAAVLVGPNGIIHHLIDRQSRAEQRSKWVRCESIAVRHKSLLS